MRRGRRSGVLVPLFSLRSDDSWGIGEFVDLPVFARWLHAAGQAIVQILPITEVPESESSPYSSLTAMALDPIYISLPALEDFQALGGESALTAEDRDLLGGLRSARRIRHDEVRTLKERCLRRCHERFHVVEDGRAGPRSSRYAAFQHRHAAWLDEFALFRALRLRYSLRPWWDWPAAIAHRETDAVQDALEELGAEIDYRKYVQWVAAEQWRAARRAARPLQVFGDVPFMISADSPDVWTRQGEFRFDATVGAPPDAFSETGQDWGLPPWRWDVMAENDFEWMRRRADRTAELFDGFRLDHLVGLYRTFIRPKDASVAPSFSPSDEALQTWLGRTLVSIYRSTGAEVIAEDLGTVPDFVRASLVKLRVPGFKVMRWERHWSAPGQPYIDPKDYDELSVATTGTHDTEPLVSWWESLPSHEKAAVLKMPSMQGDASAASAPLDALLRALLNAPSRLTVIPLQDIFAWPDRINTPAQVTEENWSWVLPWPVNRVLDLAEPRERAATLARWTHDSRRRSG